MWLSRFLTLDGISYCTHEATEFAGSQEEFWSNAEKYAQQCDYYGNADSANIFVLPSILAERPMTKVVWVDRPMTEVLHSMKIANMPMCNEAARSLMEQMTRHYEMFDLVVSFQHLEMEGGSRLIWDLCLPGIPFDSIRWNWFKNQRICYTAHNPPPVKTYEKFLPWAQSEVDKRLTHL